MGAWSTTTALTTAVYYNMCVGSHDDCLSIGAAGPSGAVNKFNSSTWATTNALNTARYQIFAAGCGGNALAYGGYTGSYVCYTTVEKFTGSTWTTTTSLLSARGFGGSLAGSNPHAGTMAVCGLQNGTGNPQTTNEYWNGSIWAVTSLLNTMRTGSYCAGDMNGGMCCGAGIIVEKWTGSAWSTTSSFSKSRFQHGVAGTSTNWVLVYGGYTGSNVMTLESELWTGSSWMTESTWTAGTGRFGFGFCGVGVGAFIAGGYTTTSATACFRYRSEGDGSFRVWSLTSSLNTSRYFHISFGSATDAIAATGAPGPIGTSEKWNGSVWTTTGSVNSPCYQATAFGDATGILAGGYYTSTLTRTEIWSGSTWGTTSAVLSAGSYSAAGIGSTTAGLYIAGFTTVPLTTVSKWNGSAWVTSPPLTVTRFYGGACGITSAALVPGGVIPSGVSAVTYTFLGTSWATTTVINIARERQAVCGSTSSAIVSGGSTAAGTPTSPSWALLDSCEHWDGSIWSIKSALNIARIAHTHVGTELAGLVAGGTETGGLIFPHTEISSNSSVDSTYFTLSGEVDVSSIPTGNRTVRLYNRDTGNQFGSVLSGAGGTFSFTVPDGNTRYFALAFPSTGESYNAAVADNVQPKTHTATWMYSGAWSTTNGFLVPRQQGFVAGVTSKAIAVSGYTGASIPITSVETWSGSSWASTSSVSGARYGHSLFGSGTRTMMISGYNAGNLLTCEYYGGTSWTSTTAVTINRTYAGYVGSIGAGLLCGGMDGASNVPLDYTTKWDGSSWTTTCTMLHPQCLVAVFGNTSAAIASAGRRNGGPEVYHQGEKWDGVVWSDTSSHIYGGYVFSACGSTNRGLCGGVAVRGITVKTASIWNGSSWATTTDQNQALASTLCGYCDAALLSGNVGLTEIFRQGLSLSGVGTWTTTGSINTGRQWGASAGNTGSALFFTGYTSGGINNNEYWSGSSWATTIAHTVTMWASLGLGGSSSAVLSVGGATGVGVAYNGCYTWNASSWATTTVFPVNKYGIAGVGDTSSALLCKGFTTVTTSTAYNGLSTSWSTTSSANVSAYSPMMWGITSSAMVAGGGPNTDAVEKWDGSSWSMTTSLLTTLFGAASAGNTSSAIIYGGNISDSGSIKTVNNTFRWTGTVWTVTTNMITSRATHRGIGDMSSALAFGGYTSEGAVYPVSCEKWSYV